MVTEPALTAAEQERRWNDTAAGFPCTADIATLFEAQVTRTPDAVAAVCGNDSLTYAALDGQANALAWQLRGHGIGPEVPVGVALERTLDRLVALLAVFKAGGVWLPLDTGYPPAQLAYTLADAGARLVLTRAALVDRLPPHDRPVLLMDKPPAPASSPPARALTPANAALMMYTSGSTGEPKGVVAPHLQLVNRFTWGIRAYPYAATDAYAHRSSVNHVISLFELVEPLLAGARTVLLPEEATRDAHQMVRAFQQHAVTRAILVPSLLRMLLDTDLDLGAALHTLAVVFVTGEPLTWEVARTFRARLPGVRLINHYGTTETNAITAYEVGATAESGTRVPIGRPLANTRLHVLDDHLQPLPPGEIGDLYIGSIGNTRGYAGRPAATAEKFIPDPFAVEPGARLYVSGDRARRLADGSVEVLGRADNQVRLHGMRVELEGVEAALARHPGVQAAAVAVHQGAAGGRQLVAYVVARAGAVPTAADLRRGVEEQLPAFMAPGRFVLVDALPLTASGKLDRRALADLAAEDGGVARASVPPSTPLQETLVHIWGAVLGVPGLGITDNFFELGGDSLLATGIIAQVRERCGVELPVRALFEAPTVAGLAAAVLAARVGQGGADAAELLALVERLSPEEAAAALAAGRLPAVD